MVLSVNYPCHLGVWKRKEYNCLLEMDRNPHAGSWWHHRKEIFAALLALCAGNSPVTSEFPTQSIDVFSDLHLNERFSKQSWGWWFEMPSCSLWRHCHDSRSFLYGHISHHFSCLLCHCNVMKDISQILAKYNANVFVYELINNGHIFFRCCPKLWDHVTHTDSYMSS